MYVYQQVSVHRNYAIIVAMMYMKGVHVCMRGVQVVFYIHIGIKIIYNLLHFAISLSLHTIIAQLTMCIYCINTL